jgi:ATPase subunit of ABC transporter with duplicated ATPase domains
LSLVDWLRQWVKTEEERDEVNIRSFLGKMIFSEEALKTCRVLSGGEKALYVIQNDDGKSECINR